MYKLVMVALVFALVGCDKITTPLQDYVPPVVPQRKVLLEDYTGHYCGNCPAAADVAEDLQEQYGDKLVVIAVHAGFFANVFPKYPASYTTTAGNDWNSYYLGENGSYPNGMVNRKNYANNGVMNTQSKWPTLTQLGFNDDYVLDLDISPNFNSTSRLLNVAIKGKFRKAYDNNVILSVVLTEDSVIGPQLDYRMSPTFVKDYVFMHMLRGSINGSWGTGFKTAPTAVNDSLVVTFNNFAVDTAFKEKHLSVVAFAYDADTREVLEAEKIKLLKTN